MRKIFRLMLILCSLVFYQTTLVHAQGKKISGTVLSEDDNTPMQNVTVTNHNTGSRTRTNNVGFYTLDAEKGHVLIFSFVGTTPKSVTVGDDETVNVKLATEEKQLENVVVTALGVRRSKRSLGYAANDVKGADIANTQRDNFLTSLAGRIPGITISQTTGMPGSSTSIILRGINSLSGSNQPLFVVDGLPVDNQTLHGNNFVTKLENRNIDFTNRISDLNPEDIESVTVLKGPEAAALYGIDAANGAIIITTKKGKSGRGSISYTFNYGIEKIGRLPEIPHVYDRGSNGVEDDVFSYFGPKYAAGTTFYDNMDGFFRTGKVSKHNISFDGGTDKITYRLSSGFSRTEGVIPVTKYDRINVTLNATAQIFPKLKAESSFQYIFSKNDKVSKGANSFYLAMLTWPADDDMSIYLNPNGSRRKLRSGSEIENPYFDVYKNVLNDKTNRFITNVGLIYDPYTWLNLTGRIGADVYSTNSFFLYHPESNRTSQGGVVDVGNSNVRNLTIQYYATGRKNFFNNKIKTTLRAGSAVYDWNFQSNAARGEKFIEPDFKSLNNTDPTTQRQFSNMSHKRLVGLFGDLNINYDNFVYLTLTGRNDWSSTLPKDNNSFFYPSASLSFVFTDLFEGKQIGPLTMGKLRLSSAQVGKDALPYSLYPGLEAQTSTGGGYGYGFTAPNPLLRPEKVTSKEIGAELQFFKNNRLSLDVSYYKTKSVDQIINGLRISYGTGFVLKNVNAGEAENSGIEILLRGSPVQRSDFNWEVSVNFAKTNSRLLTLGEDIPEYYNSDTWLFGNVRNGSRVGNPLTTFTARFTFARNDKGDILISPSTGLPIQIDNPSWPVAGDRNPDFTMGVTNSFYYKGLSFSFLWDIRKGGDVYNATGLYLYTRGLHEKAIENRETLMIYPGILRDGLENTANPTVNNISINPYYNNTFYSSILDQEFIERDVNWLRLRDVTLSYELPLKWVDKTKVFKRISLGITGTDLLLYTNYSGGDPGSNAVTAATGGSGGGGFDYGALPVSKRYNFTLRTTF